MNADRAHGPFLYLFHYSGYWLSGCRAGGSDQTFDLQCVKLSANTPQMSGKNVTIIAYRLSYSDTVYISKPKTLAVKQATTKCGQNQIFSALIIRPVSLTSSKSISPS